jgi:hypothetical protein
MEGRQTRPGTADYVVCGQIVHTYRLGFDIPAWLPYWDAGPTRVQRMEGTGPEEPKDIDRPKINRILRLAKNQSLDRPLAG